MKISDKDKGLVTEGSILEHYFGTGERVYDTKAIENGEIADRHGHILHQFPRQGSKGTPHCAWKHGKRDPETWNLSIWR